MTFDYIRSVRPRLITQLFEFRLPERLHAPASALLCAVLCVSGAWTIESRRLADARTTQTQAQRRYDEVRLETSRANLFYRRICDLVALDQRVREVSTSGDLAARRLTEIANAVPANVWLTSIAWEGSDVELEGGSKNLSVLSGIFQRLGHGRSVTNPTLVRAQQDPNANAMPFTTYSIHAQVTGP